MVDELSRGGYEALSGSIKKKRIALAVLLVLAIAMFFVALMVGSSKMSWGESFMALFGQGTPVAVRIVQNVRLPEAIAAAVAGAGLSIAGLIMQSTLKNPMASPSTLGVSNAAVFGANLSIIGFAGGFFDTGNHPTEMFSGSNPFATGAIAFFFALASTVMILFLCKLRSFSSETVVLAGIALGTVWTALTTLLQYYATDVGLSAAVVWSFGDLSRATFKTDWIMFAVVAAGCVFFYLLQWRFNAINADSFVANTLGVKVELLRFLALLVASLITAVCVSCLGIIGFVGIICPHAMRRIVGNNHRYLIPASILSGSFLLLFASTMGHLIGNGSSLPVGAITAILGGPFFLFLIFTRKGGKA